MSHRTTRRVAPILTTLCLSLIVGTLPLQVACGGKSQDKASNAVPTISSFLISSDGKFDIRDKKNTFTAIDATAGATIYLKAAFSNNSGSAVVMPGNIVLKPNTSTPIVVTATTSYTLTVTSDSGASTSTVTSATGATSPAQATVTVKSAPVIQGYSNEDATYYVGVKIADNTVTATGTAPIGYTSTTLPGGLSIDASTGTISGTPTTLLPRAAYTITATNSVSPVGVSKAIYMTVADPQVSFQAGNAVIPSGGSTSLSWDASVIPSLFSSVTITASPVDASLTAWLAANPGALPLKGSINGIAPTTATTYTLHANSPSGGTLTRTATVTVGATALALVSIKADPATTTYGGPSTLSWTYTGIPTELTLDGSTVLGSMSQVVSPVRRHTYTLKGKNDLNASYVSLPQVVAARGLDLLAGSIQGAGAKDSTIGTSAQFNTPRQMAADNAGRIFLADEKNQTIRMISTTGAVTTIAGTIGVTGATNSPALFNAPRGIAVSSDGTKVYVYDAGNKAIRLLSFDGTVWTASTLTSALGASSYGHITLDPTGAFLLIVDAGTGGVCIRALRLSDNTLGIYAGTGTFGTTDGVSPALAAFDGPEGIAFNKAGTYFYVSEYYSGACSRIRMIPWTAPANTGAITAPTTGTVITIAGGVAKGYLDGAGSAALFQNPSSIAVDSNDVLWATDYTNSVIRKIVVNSATPGDSTVTTVAGTVPTGTSAAPVPSPGSVDGPAASAKFNGINGLLALKGKLYISETSNSDVRVFDGTTVSTFAGTPRLSGNINAIGAAARFSAPQGVAYYGGYAYVADTGNSSLRKVSLTDGTTTTVASTGFTLLKGVAADSTGRIYVTDATAKTLLQVASDGTLTTILSAGLTLPSNVTVSPVNPNLLYVVDGNAVQEVTVVRDAGTGAFTSASITKTIGVAATSGALDGAFGTARFKMSGYFSGLAVDGSGNIFVADEGNYNIRKIAATTYDVTTIAGIKGNSGYLEGALATNKFGFVMGLALDASGNLYVADQGNHTVRKIATDGTVSSLVGLSAGGFQARYGANPGTLDGTGTASLYSPNGLAITADGDLLVVTNDGIMQITAPTAP